MSVPQKGLNHWVALHPSLGGPLQGVIYGLVLGTFASLLNHQRWVETVAAAMIVGIVLGTWRAYAMQRALAADRNTPYQR